MTDMKYTKKTGIEIMTEEDRLEVIPFFEHHFPKCNGSLPFPYSEFDIKIGQIWAVFPFRSRENWFAYINDDKDYELITKDYTILKGVPQNWREESEPTEPSRLDQLESENNEMRDSLKSILDMYETDNRDANDWYDLMYKAKQLLEK